MKSFDVIVVGKGLIGCAAAKYLSRNNLKVGIIGPDEPESYSDGEIFASHYDSGRILRQIGKNPAMTRINQQSLEEYAVLQRETKINFHSKNGCLYINPYGQDKYLTSIEDRARSNGVAIKLYLNAEEIKNDFPYLEFPKNSKGVFESGPSGHINPKLLIKAQLKVIENNNGTIVKEIVHNVTYKENNIIIQTSNGNIYTCHKVIFTPGAFSNHFKFFKNKLNLTIKSETVILGQLTSIDVAKLKKLPSILYEIETHDIEGIYATQPIKYPDGNYYLKIGANLPNDIYFTSSLKEIKEWFANGNSDANVTFIAKHLRRIMPGIQFKNIRSKRCILTRTNQESENPFIGTIEPGRSYLAVGNGWSGGNSDGSGYVVSYLAMTGTFPKGLSSKDFDPVWIS